MGISSLRVKVLTGPPVVAIALNINDSRHALPSFELPLLLQTTSMLLRVARASTKEVVNDVPPNEDPAQGVGAAAARHWVPVLVTQGQLVAATAAPSDKKVSRHVTRYPPSLLLPLVQYSAPTNAWQHRIQP